MGPIEKEDTIKPNLLEYFWSCEDIIKTDRVTNVEKYISAMDIFVLPTYREGFGMSVIEASAMAVPVVVTKYPGPSSAMEEGVTGISVDIKNTAQIILAVSSLLEHEEQRIVMGQAGRSFVEHNFEQKEFIKRYMENRMSLLGLKEITKCEMEKEHA